MVHFVQYEGSLEINPSQFRGALDTFNKLHTIEMLDKYAIGGTEHDRQYIGVDNPKHPYKTLKEAFDNWGIFEDYETYIDEDSHNFVVRGVYSNNIGQQEFLLEQLAPYITDTTISVAGDDGWKYIWMVECGNFYSYSYRDKTTWEPPQYALLPEHLEKENMSLAM